MCYIVLGMTQGIFFNIDQIRKGNRNEFGRVYSEYFDMLFNLANQYLMDQDEAYGIVQDSFIKLWENKRKLKKNSNLKNYLYTVVKNQCLNLLRERKNQVFLSNGVADLESEYNYEALTEFADNAEDYEKMREEMHAAIEALPEDLKVVFKMNRFEGMRYKDIAQQFNLSQKAIEARMSKALKLIRERLQEYKGVIHFT
jgi:RNA polymerase sigma-70 factor (ECF subfamily)